MRSKASIQGHPIHPALIPFPFAFLYGALIFDALGVVTDRPALWTTGGHLAAAGVLAALVAAVPGLMDYAGTVPPRSTAKTRATKHMVVNLSAVALMAGAWLLRPDRAAPPPTAILAMEAVAVALLTMGGWMGGTLVNRNQIGVDHRYANGGKWKEATIAAAAGKAVAVARADELEANQLKLLRIGGRRVALARTEDAWLAVADACPHRGGSLADGVVICGTVQCPWHGSQFDLRSGAVRAGPAEQPVAVFPVEVRDGQVWLTLPEGSGTG